MASFTDTIPQFNPYVSQQPVESMVQVGMMKQEQYDTNLQRIQETMSNISGLDIVRDSDKQYLQDKISDMNRRLKLFASGDFSNGQLTSTVNGMIGGIADDDIVRNSVHSTMRYREQMDTIRKEQEEGTLAPENYYDFQQQANQWLTNTEPGAAFNGQYSKYFDVLEYTREVFDDIKPDGYTFDEVFAVGEDGEPKLNPAMRRLKREGLMPEKVRQVVNQVFADPRVSKQLAITGKYNYRGDTPEILKQKLTVQKSGALKALESERERLLVQVDLGKASQEDIDAVDDAMERMETTFQQYMKMADESPDGLRSHIYTEETRDRYTDMFTYKTEETTWHSNPQWKGAFEIQKEANANKRFNTRLEWDMLKAQSDDKFRWAKLAAENADKNELVSSPPVPGQIPSTFDKVAYHNHRVDEAAKRFNLSSNKLIWEYIISKDPNNNAKLRNLISSESGLSQAAAVDRILTEEAIKSYQNDNPLIDTADLTSDEIENIVSVYKTNKLAIITQEVNSGIYNVGDEDWQKHKTNERDFTILNGLDKKVNQEFAKAIDNLDLSSIDDSNMSVVDIDGNTIILTREDILDLALSEEFDVQYFIQDNERKEKKRIGEIATNRISSKLSDKMIAFLQGKLSNIGNRSGMEYQGIKKAVFDIKNQLEKSTEMLEAVQEKERLIDNFYQIDPNLNYKLFTGDTETDNNFLRQIKLAISSDSGIYDNPLNASESFDAFKTEVAGETKPADLDINAHIFMNEENQPMARLVTSTGNQMAVPVEFLERFGVNINKDLGSSDGRKVKELTNDYISTAGAADPYSKETYRNGLYFYSNIHFPHFSGSKDMNVKVNFVKDMENNFKPVIFVQYFDAEGNQKSDILPRQTLEGFNDIDAVISNLKAILSPAWVKQKLMELNRI